MATQSNCKMCSGILGSGTVSLGLYQGEAEILVCSSRCLVAFAVSEYEEHSNRQLTQIRKSLDAAKLILESGGRIDAVLAEIEKIRKAAWLIDHGKADSKA